MKKYFSILFFSLILFQQSSYTQVFEDVGNDIIEFLNTGKDLTTDFVKFDKSTQLNLVGSAVLIGAGYSIDNNVKDFAQKNSSTFNDGLFSIDNVYGAGITLIGIGGLYGYGVIFKDKEVRKIGLQTIEAVGYSGIIESILKSAVGRSRPYTNEGKAKFRPFNFNAAHTSFPSGHSTVSFAVSTVLANNTDNVYLKIFCFTASTLVCCARIYHSDHWLSDTITGGLLGYFAGNYVSSKNTLQKESGDKLSVNFSLTGVDLSLAF
ncbi:MAG: phosphatase PAP2 family protein [Ignavibacteriaceae bacterium]|nr:phosphatase PAP2 family protein [Ignavibacteriaceae bacterium]